MLRATSSAELVRRFVENGGDVVLREVAWAPARSLYQSAQLVTREIAERLVIVSHRYSPAS